MSDFESEKGWGTSELRGCRCRIETVRWFIALPVDSVRPTVQEISIRKLKLPQTGVTKNILATKRYAGEAGAACACNCSITRRISHIHTSRSSSVRALIIYALPEAEPNTYTEHAQKFKTSNFCDKIICNNGPLLRLALPQERKAGRAA